MGVFEKHRKEAREKELSKEDRIIGCITLFVVGCSVIGLLGVLAMFVLLLRILYQLG